MTRAIHNGIAKPGQARARAQAIQCFIFGAKFYPGHPPEIQCALPLAIPNDRFDVYIVTHYTFLTHVESTH